jgi:hypothetical protein
VEVERAYQRGHRLEPRWRPAWVCRRGPSSGTLDDLLYREFLRRGGQVRFSSGEDWSGYSPSRRILATGLHAGTMSRLGLPSRRILGYHAVGPGRSGVSALHYRDPGLGKDFAYAANLEGQCYALVFSRDELPESAVRLVRELLCRTEGIELDPWIRLEGAVPVQPLLFHREGILAGALAGMIDPFYLSGLSGGLISGWLAALAVVQPERAMDEFRWFCRNHSLSARLCRFAQEHPRSLPAYLAAASIHSCLTPVGSLR